MIINCDAKGLEWYCAAYLSQDKVAMQEIYDGIDQHGSNQKAFGLPTRLISKVFLFRIIYANLKYAAHTYANDADFMGTSSSKKFWQKVIDEFVTKYNGFTAWHDRLVQEVTQTGRIVMPTGRIYSFDRDKKGEWPITQIYNYPVQGLGADIMSIIRISFRKRFIDAGVAGVIINTVHDSIVVDVPKHELPRVAQIFYDVFNDFPANFKRVFGLEFNLPLRCEILYGNNMKELEEYGI